MKHKVFSSFIKFVILVLIISSCKKEEFDKKERVYYQFTIEDLSIIPNLHKDQQLLYRNQNNDEILFNISSVRAEKDTLTYIFGFFCPDYRFCFDSYRAYFHTYIDNESFSGAYYFWRYPIDLDLAQSDIYTLYPSEFNQYVSFPFWNGMIRSVNLSEPQGVISMEIGDILYNVVKVYNSNNNEPTSPERNVRILYFVDKIGIIGYDDLNGNEWRLY